MTCALRVRLLEVPHNPRSLQSLGIRKKTKTSETEGNLEDL